MSAPAPHVRRRRRDRTYRLRELGFDSYDDYLASPHWQALKARYRASTLPQECMCGATDGLHLHHKTYERIGNELLEDLTPLCPTCHSMVHVLDARGEMGISLVDFANTKRAERYAPAQERRTAVAQGEYRDEHLRRMARSLAGRVKRAAMHGDLDAEDIAAIEAILDRASEQDQAA